MRGFNFNTIRNNPPECPLCLKQMELRYDGIRKMEIFVCHRDRIAIAVTDPLVGHWKDKREKIPCPFCNADMRVFFTSAGYMKAKCPKKTCGGGMAGSNPDRFTMRPALKLDGIVPEGGA